MMDLAPGSPCVLTRQAVPRHVEQHVATACSLSSRAMSTRNPLGNTLAYLMQQVPEQGSFRLGHLLRKVGHHHSAGSSAPPPSQKGHNAVRQLLGLPHLHQQPVFGA